MNKVEFNNLKFSDAPERLRGMLKHCGYSAAKYHNYNFDGTLPQHGESAIWQYTLAGEGAVEFNNEVFPVMPGEALLLVTPEQHRYFLPRQSEYWEFLYITVAGQELLRIFELFRQRHGVVCRFDADSKVVNNAWEVLHRLKNHDIADCYSASAAAYDFVMALCASTTVNCTSKEHKMLKKIQEFCMANIHRQIMVEELAAIAGCSRWYFSRRFAELSGFTPHDFIMDLKMRHAIKMLESNLSIKEIVEQIGFSNSAYFCRAFRKTFGVPPGRFRNGKNE